MPKVQVKPKNQILYDRLRDEGMKKKKAAKVANEDEGNPGNHSLPTGGSLVGLVAIIVIVVLLVRRRR